MTPALLHTCWQLREANYEQCTRCDYREASRSRQRKLKANHAHRSCPLWLVQLNIIACAAQATTKPYSSRGQQQRITPRPTSRPHAAAVVLPTVNGRVTADNLALYMPATTITHTALARTATPNHSGSTPTGLTTGSTRGFRLARQAATAAVNAVVTKIAVTAVGALAMFDPPLRQTLQPTPTARSPGAGRVDVAAAAVKMGATGRSLSPHSATHGAPRPCWLKVQ